MLPTGRPGLLSPKSSIPSLASETHLVWQLLRALCPAGLCPLSRSSLKYFPGEISSTPSEVLTCLYPCSPYSFASKHLLQCVITHPFDSVPTGCLLPRRPVCFVHHGVLVSSKAPDPPKSTEYVCWIHGSTDTRPVRWTGVIQPLVPIEEQLYFAWSSGHTEILPPRTSWGEDEGPNSKIWIKHYPVYSS